MFLDINRHFVFETPVQMSTIRKRGGEVIIIRSVHKEYRIELRSNKE